MTQHIPSRYASRCTTDANHVLGILNQTLFCSIAYISHNKPFCLPTGFCVINDQLIIHGSVKSNFLNELLKVEEVCISTFLFDGLVLATSAFEHAVNYRSTAIFSKAKEITGHEEKLEALKVFTEKYIPGRWDLLRPITDSEINGTRVLSFTVDNACLKKREGPPSFKKDEWIERVWTGEVPAKICYLDPVVNPGQQRFEKLPEHIEQLLTT